MIILNDPKQNATVSNNFNVIVWAFNCIGVFYTKCDETVIFLCWFSLLLLLLWFSRFCWSHASQTHKTTTTNGMQTVSARRVWWYEEFDFLLKKRSRKRAANLGVKVEFISQLSGDSVILNMYTANKSCIYHMKYHRIFALFCAVFSIHTCKYCKLHHTEHNTVEVVSLLLLLRFFLLFSLNSFRFICYCCCEYLAIIPIYGKWMVTRKRSGIKLQL